MTSSEHRKHAKLTRPALGNFGRKEWALVGAPCGKIQALAQQLIAQLSRRFTCAYVDASHQMPEAPAMLTAGASKEYTDAIQFRQLTATATWGMHQYRTVFNDCDVVLVNGNHHAAAAQVVIIDPSKEASLKRRLPQLTNVELLLFLDDSTAPFDFLEDALPDFQSIPRLMLDDEAGILAFFDRALNRNIAPLNGLVLAGGQSTRMGRDKGRIEWHGKPQREYLRELLQPVCETVFISCRPDQLPDFEPNTPTITDAFVGLGPFGALLSAFQAQPDSAWLVVACDLPLLDSSTVDFLVKARCVRKIATAFQSPRDEFPEPLITIWEPKAYLVLLSFLAQGYSCPRKVLINSDPAIVQAPNPAALQNVNTPADFEQVKLELALKQA